MVPIALKMEQAAISNAVTGSALTVYLNERRNRAHETNLSHCKIIEPLSFGNIDAA
jgi:hypothetical protein